MSLGRCLCGLFFCGGLCGLFLRRSFLGGIDMVYLGDLCAVIDYGACLFRSFGRSLCFIGRLLARSFLCCSFLLLLHLLLRLTDLADVLLQVLNLLLEVVTLLGVLVIEFFGDSLLDLRELVADEDFEDAL